jgi:hypothetical protein
MKKGLAGANSPFTAGRAFLSPFMPEEGEGPVMNIKATNYKKRKGT